MDPDDERDDDLVDDGGNPISETEREVAQALNDAFRKLGENVPQDEMVAAFQAVERRFTTELTEDAALLLEVRRRVAEGILVGSEEYDVPVEQILELLERVIALGWSSLYVKAQTLGHVARYCLDRGRKDVGLRLLVPLMTELEDEGERQAAPWVSNHLEAVRELLARIR